MKRKEIYFSEENGVCRRKLTESNGFEVYTYPIFLKDLNYKLFKPALMKWYLSHMRTAKVQASL